MHTSHGRGGGKRPEPHQSALALRQHAETKGRHARVSLFAPLVEDNSSEILERLRLAPGRLPERSARLALQPRKSHTHLSSSGPQPRSSFASLEASSAFPVFQPSAKKGDQSE